MRRAIAVLILVTAAAALLLAATVGQGAPNPAAFINAYDRGLFSILVGPPPNPVQDLAGGGGALVQEFPSLANSKVNYALIENNPAAPVSQFDTLQLSSDLYTYYTSVGASVAGLPTMDTSVCPASSFGVCDYQLFTKDTALFVYSTPLAASYSVADPFYTRWTAGGGIGGALGVVTSAQTPVTSESKVAGTEQTFLGGAIFSYPAGSANPNVYAVLAPVIAACNSAGGYAIMGFPTSEAFEVNSTGLMRQTFENGRIEWTGSNTPNVLFPVGQVEILYASQGLALAAGATATVTAATFDDMGNLVTGRALQWATTNGAVATVLGNGYTAVVTGVGAGSANIYATSEGITSPNLVATVGSTACCAVGQGAPTAAITQAFQTAIARNNISVLLPASAPVTRAGNGYIQTFASADGLGTVYVIAEADGSGTAWLLTGSLYTAYLANGGFTGALGYPVSDPLPGGMQDFASGAILAGLPVHVIPSAIAVRWLALGGSAAGAGPPTGDATAFASFSGAKGFAQAFANGEIFGIVSGTASGQNLAGAAFFSNGLILARYLALSGPAGALGIPISDVYTSGAQSLENFEGGYITLQPGATAAVEHYNPANPALTASPTIVIPGGTVHLAASGFGPGATLAFTITGQPPFSVTSASGTFQWNVVVPASAKPGVVSVQATGQGTVNTASASYTIALPAALLPSLSIVSGNLQTGLPGSTLAAPIVVALLDSQGNPILGAAVSTTASPGATATPSSAITDPNGMATVAFRLPPTAGVAAGSVAAGGLAVNFSALSSASSLPNFPAFTQTTQQTSLTVSLAALIAWSQNAGTLASPNGASTPAALTQFLAADNGFVLSEAGDSIPNPWVAARFAATAISLEIATVSHLLDLLNQGYPVAVNLSVSVDGSLNNGATVTAIGVNADGSIAISDPNPAFSRTSLSDYLNGFVLNGHTVTGKLASFVRIVPPQPATGAAPFTAGSQLSAGEATGSLAGACLSLDIQGSTASAGSRFQYCDGSQPAYEADFIAPKGASLLDLSSASIPAPVPIPATALSWSILRKSGNLTVSPASLAITGVVDSAAFGPAISPGDLFSIFGSGFAGAPVVTLGGKPVSILATFPFQINAVIPATAAPGNSSLQVTGPDGSATTNLTLSAAAPGIFESGGLASIENSDGSLNTPANPAQRGQFVSVYCTGLGASTAPAPTFTVNGSTVKPSYAGPVAGFIGLYQINATIPSNLPPSLTGTLAIQQASQTSNTVPVAIQ